MNAPLRSVLFALLVTLLAVPLARPSAAQTTAWVVSPTPGPGVDFTSLQDAMDAAADGDHLLLLDGTHSFGGLTANSHLIDGKGLHLVAQNPGRVRVTPGFRILNLAADQAVSLRGIDVLQSSSSFKREALDIQGNAGSVWIEDGEFHATEGFFLGGEPNSAAFVRDSASVTFVDCVLRADDVGFCCPSTPLGDGLSVVDSHVRLFGCEVIGGRGVDSSSPGRPGARVAGGSLVASGSTFVGGVGGAPSYIPLFGACIEDGVGGSAVRVTDHFVFSDHTYFTTPGDFSHQDSVFQPGPGGVYTPLPGDPIACSNPPAGETIQVDAGTVNALSGEARSYRVTSPGASGATLSLGFDGAPGDLVMVGIATAPGGFFLPSLGAPVVLTDPVTWSPGSLDGAGQLTVQLRVPDLGGPGPLGLAVYSQAVFLTTAQEAFAGSPSLLVVLDNVP